MIRFIRLNIIFFILINSNFMSAIESKDIKKIESSYKYLNKLKFNKQSFIETMLDDQLLRNCKFSKKLTDMEKRFTIINKIIDREIEDASYFILQDNQKDKFVEELTSFIKNCLKDKYLSDEAIILINHRLDQLKK